MRRPRRNRVPLTRQRKLEALAGGGMIFRGKPLNVSAAAADRYGARLDRHVSAMATEVEAAVRGLYRDHAPHLTTGLDASMSSQARILFNAMADRFYTFFSKIAPDLARKMTDDVNAHSKSNLHSSLREMSGGLSLKTGIITGRIQEATKAAIANNVALIKSIPDKYFTDVQNSVFTSIQKGNGLQDVVADIIAIGHSTKKRAKFIALDQTRKATSAINEARMTELGLREFEWLHSRGDREPRPLHIGQLNHKIFAFATPPIIDERTGERGLPGQLIGCTCRMIPVVRFGAKDDEDEREDA